MYMAMLVALTLAFPSCNVEMELGNNTLEYRERTAYLCSYDWQDDWYDDYACTTPGAALLHQRNG